jgi:hypothetical protein
VSWRGRVERERAGGVAAAAEGERAELRMRCDVLKRSAAFWVEDAMRR